MTPQSVASTPTLPPEDRVTSAEALRRRNRRRLFTLLFVALLIGVPAFVLVKAGRASRESGRDKEAEALATGLQPVRPLGVKMRVYDVPIPAGATSVRYYETNNWKSSRLYAQFDVTSGRLDTFLNQMGTNRSSLRPTVVPISQRDQQIAHWNFAVPGHRWAGLVHKEHDPLPTVNVVADLSDPASPRVYVVSTTSP